MLAPLLGRIDRFDRRIVMITGDSIAAVGTLVALAFALAGRLEVWYPVIAAVVGGIGTAIQMPAARAAVPEMVDHDHSPAPTDSDRSDPRAASWSHR